MQADDFLYDDTYDGLWDETNVPPEQEEEEEEEEEEEGSPKEGC